MTTAIAPKTIVPAGTWAVDPAHSKAGFSVKHMGVSTVRGEFRELEGSFEIGEDLSSASVQGSVRAASVDTNEAQRDEHLRSPDFFDVEQFPELRFESKSVDQLDEDTLRITGYLTLHGVTQELELQAEVEGTGIGPDGSERIGLGVTGQLSRGDYGMKFNQALGSGNVMVSDKVKLALDIEAVKQG